MLVDTLVLQAPPKLEMEIVAIDQCALSRQDDDAPPFRSSGATAGTGRCTACAPRLQCVFPMTR
jgi:hypothetical protein